MKELKERFLSEMDDFEKKTFVIKENFYILRKYWEKCFYESFFTSQYILRTF